MKMAEAGYPTEKISIKGNFISKAKDGAIAEKSENYCLYLGRLSDEKGIKTLLSAFKKIEGCTLKIAGAGPLEDLVRLSISENVEYLGFVGKVEKEKLLNNAMFLILPSECYEAFPVVIIEAYMARIPVITSRLGSLPEIVKDGETGFLFRPGDVTDLRAKIRYFIGNSGECKRMGMNAYEFAEERFSEENNYEQLMAIYNGVVR